MPFFGNKDKKKKKETKRVEATPSDPEHPANVNTAPPVAGTPAQTPSEEAPQIPVVKTPPKELVFAVQLAHGSATKKIKDFTNVRELYLKVADQFGLESNQVLFCTLNTHKVDMQYLLGGQIGLQDFIFVHIKGSTREITIMKSEASLGLTITDNGSGCSFVKRIRENSVSARCGQILIGDHIQAINGKPMTGCRHIEVAKTLKELPVDQNFTITLVEPMKAFDAIAPRGAGGLKAGDPKPEDLQNGKQTLRLKSTGQAVVETVDETSWVGKAVVAVDDCLEAFMGIRDTELSETIVDFHKELNDATAFAKKVNEEFEDFEFPEDFISELWAVVDGVRHPANDN